jgi:hypothetical protein
MKFFLLKKVKYCLLEPLLNIYRPVRRFGLIKPACYFVTYISA